ncbi:hypothetical protein SAMN00120144_1501 [Hymenobacter roseosalivarius DSM 11622]|uniref:Zinc-finger domain-containing protein n=1 Tax=Hymenobacter roseosalivarius DSM 11622 TaxID=645990 RepID=A0A1W1V1K2_9BACT|nr:hypothetical protein [Hymenobacter roseosalivarius]SMB87192.1 hypothetical protein SAMN00120144_1501 [Hymenobacter roseosalivarius DSM 11622]
MLRFISCQQATLLIEQRADAPLARADHNSLWLHLRYCPYCNRYARQTALISRLAQAAAAADQPGLSAEARQRIRQRLSDAEPGGEKNA